MDPLPEDQPSLDNRCRLLQAELALPLATVRAGLERLRANQLDTQHAEAAVEALAELEAMLLGVVAIAFELAPAFPQRRTALTPLIQQALAAASQGSEGRVRVHLEGALFGSWNPWACRRTVHELVTFALALTDATIAVSAKSSGRAVRLSVQVTGVRPGSVEGQLLVRELGPAPRQFHLWLASRLVESAGGRVEVAADPEGWVCLIATWPGLLEENAVANP
jgi:hypothetical protein